MYIRDIYIYIYIYIYILYLWCKQEQVMLQIYFSTFEVSYKDCWYYRIDIQFYLMSPRKALRSALSNYGKEEPFCAKMIWPVSNCSCEDLGFL